MKKSFLFLFYFFLCTSYFSQISETYFDDTELKDGATVDRYLKYNNTIIVSAQTFEHSLNQPAIICFDTLGTQLWNTALADSIINQPYGSRIQKMILGTDGYIYAYSSSPNFFWKVNPTNGAIIWRKTFNNYQFGQLLDYDSNAFIVSYAKFWGNTQIALVSKVTGDTLSVQFSRTGYGVFPMEIDNQKNIYVSYSDSIFKLSSIVKNTVIWSNKAIQTSNMNIIHYDSLSNSVFYLGNTYTGPDRGRILKYNANTGALISYVDQSFSAVAANAIKIVGSTMYISWQHIYVGSIIARYSVSKYDMITGTFIWDTNYQFIGIGSPVTTGQSGDSQAAVALDVDNSGNVYLTGYYGDANYGPENWGILKLNGANGNALYEKTITQDTLNYDDLSNGKVVCVINNIPYFIGELQTSSYRASIAFVSLNPITGTPVIRKIFKAGHKFPSATIAIKKYNSSQTLVMKQMGRMIKLEMYSFSKNLLWSKSFSTEYFLYGKNLSTTPNGQIYFSAYSMQQNSSSVDSIIVYKLDALGNAIGHYSFRDVLGNNIWPVELLTDNVSALVFYRKNNSTLYYRKLSASTINNEYSSNITYSSLLFNSKHVINKNNNIAYIFEGNSSFISLDKNTMTTSTTVAPSIYNISTVNYVFEADTNKVILCGKNYYGKETMTLFNPTLNDTVWVRTLTTNTLSQVVQCVTDPQKNNVYSISTNSNNIVARKVSMLNGSQKWSYTYNGAAGFYDDFPTDIAYDPFKNQVLIAGYKTINSSKHVVILTLDTLGNALDTIIKIGTIVGDNIATCVNILPDGTQWVGGNLRQTLIGEAGFIYELSSAIATAVWPGDANSDGIADNLDVLELGLHYTQTGTPRASISNTWQSYFSTNWTGTITNGKNLNHSDCNGDGFINAGDTLAIFNNYGLSHAFRTAQTNTTNIQLSIIPDQASVAKGSWGTASVYLGDATSPISNVNGLAFTVSFDNTLVETNNIYIQYQNSFLNVGQNLDFKKLNFSNGKLYTATTHTVNNNVSGYGKIATLHYQIKSTLTTDQILNFAIIQANQSDASGTIIPLASGTGTLLAMGASVGLQELNGNVIYLSPNPTNGALTINSKTELQKIEVISVDGKVLLNEVPTNVSHTLHLDNFANGIYFVNLYQNDRVVKREKVVLNK